MQLEKEAVTIQKEQPTEEHTEPAYQTPSEQPKEEALLHQAVSGSSQIEITAQIPEEHKQEELKQEEVVAQP